MKFNKRSFKDKVQNKYSTYSRNKRIDKKYKNYKMKPSSNTIFRILGMLNGIPAILVVIFLWRRWGDITDYFNNLFHKGSNFYRGSLNDLPENFDYYNDLQNQIFNSIDGIAIYDKTFYDIIMSLNKYELQYVTDLYNKHYYFKGKGLIIDIKGEMIDSNYWNDLKEKFAEAGIPF